MAHIQKVHAQNDRKKLLARVRRIKGQAQALEMALERGQECADVLQQISAIRGAANGLMFQVLEGHIREHLGGGADDAMQRAQDVEHIVAILKSYMK